MTRESPEMEEEGFGKRMPSIYDIKPKFQALLRPLTGRLAAIGVTANQVTLTALALSVLLGLFMAMNAPARWPLWLVPVWMFARMALNAIDGMLAREHHMKSDLGALLNELGDVLADAALYLPLALWLGPAGRGWLVVVVVLAVVSEMAGVCAVQIGAARRYDGPMGKSDRAFWLGALALALALGAPGGAWAAWGLAVVAGMLVLTIFNRAWRALAEAERGKGEAD
jgi:CDP-diacylglycerol--glycerol-3-phosphate 3-phosphatidyltransferase